MSNKKFGLYDADDLIDDDDYYDQEGYDSEYD